MSVPVTFSFANLPSGYCFADPASYWTDLQALITGTVDAGVGANLGDTTPSVDDRDKVWHRLDATGNFIRTYAFANGLWVSQHPIPPSSSYRALWVGAEADLLTFDEGVNEAITEFTGPFWAADHNVDYKVLMAPGTDATTYNGAAARTLAVGGTDGASMVQLAETEIPAHRHSITLRDNNTDTEPLPAAGDPGAAASPNGNTGYVGGDTPGSLGTTVYHENLPPVYGIFVIKRTARKWYSVAG